MRRHGIGEREARTDAAEGADEEAVDGKTRISERFVAEALRRG
jgi:hypothetical protein